MFKLTLSDEVEGCTVGKDKVEPCTGTKDEVSKDEVEAVGIEPCTGAKSCD